MKTWRLILINEVPVKSNWKGMKVTQREVVDILETEAFSAEYALMRIFGELEDYPHEFTHTEFCVLKD